ncbi:hypothetical protein EVAR_83471_1 [Eumeta japonica]|uniref:Uncharacterized protein n=1 Tax=Eumeta variegata TaxID=151549 RepID=A0A4C1ZHI4_EUMVA|nr:hypothetical protein EVAR_83471_1 [Eumeta japonica]
MPSVAVVALSSDSIRHGLNVAQRNEGRVASDAPAAFGKRRLGRISYPHASHKLPRRSSPAQANFRSSFHSYRGPTCVDDVPVLTTGLSAHSLTSYEVLETRICSIRGWKTGRVVARSTVDMHRVRVRNRASVERPSPGAYSPAPICACVSTRQGYSAPRSYSATGDHASTSHTARKR